MSMIGNHAQYGQCQIARDLNGDGTVDMGIKMTATPPTDGRAAKSFNFKIVEYLADGTTLVDTYYEASKTGNKKFGPVIAGHVYEISASALTSNGIESAFSASARITPIGKGLTLAPPILSFSAAVPFGLIANWPSPTDADYAYTDVYFSTTNSFSSALLNPTFRASGGYALLTGFTPLLTYYFWIKHFDRTGNSTAQSGFVSVPITPLYKDYFLDNAINDAPYTSATTASQAVGIGSTTTIETVSVTHGAGANTVEIHGSLRNVSGGVRTVDITIEDGSGNILASYPSTALADNGCAFPFARISMPSGSVTSVRLRVNCAAASSFNNTKLYAFVRQR